MLGPSVVAWWTLKDDPLELAEAGAPEPEDGLEALAAELACVECPAELIQARALLLEDLVTRGLNQNQVPRTLLAVSEANEAFTLKLRQRFDLPARCHAVLFSPIFGRIDPRDIVEWLLADKLDVRFQLQMHKFIWTPTQRGV